MKPYRICSNDCTCGTHAFDVVFWAQPHQLAKVALVRRVGEQRSQPNEETRGFTFWVPTLRYVLHFSAIICPFTRTAVRLLVPI